MQETLDEWAANAGQPRAPDWMEYISPARYDHMNFRGTFHFPVNLYAERLFERENSPAQAFTDNR